MKLLIILTLLGAVNAYASDPPKADDKKPAERSAVPERIIRPKLSPDSLPQPVEKDSKPAACVKFEFKEKNSKIECLIKPAVVEKPKAAAH